MHGSRHNLSGIVSGYQPEVSHASARCGRNLVLVEDARALLCPPPAGAQTRRRFALTLQFEGLLSLFEIRHSRNSRSSELFDIWVVDSATYIVKLHYMNPEIGWPW